MQIILPVDITSTSTSTSTNSHSQANDDTTAMLRNQRQLGATSTSSISHPGSITSTTGTSSSTSSTGTATAGAGTAGGASPSLTSSFSECLDHLLLLGRSQQSNKNTTTSNTSYAGDSHSSPFRHQSTPPTLQFTLTSRQTLALYSSFISTASVYVSDVAASASAVTNRSSESGSPIAFDSTSIRGAIMTAWGGIVRILGGVGTTVLSNLLYV